MMTGATLLLLLSCALLQPLKGFIVILHPVEKWQHTHCALPKENSNDEISPSTNASKPDQPSSEFLKNQKSMDPFQATGREELFKTIAGGTALIFEMARKSITPATTTTNARRVSSSSVSQPSLYSSSSSLPYESPQQRRWYPHSGISDENPSFRTQSPAMTNEGFAKVIWKNARKRNKQSLWKYALRTYDRMGVIEGDPNFVQIKRSNIHHEGAMVAAAKLGKWQRALEIFHYVGSNSSKSVFVTDDMVSSLVRGTVRASRLRLRRKNSHEVPLTPEQEEQEAALRRIPLDTTLEILSSLPEDHNIPCYPYFFNPLAAAYQSLGYTQHSKEILDTMLSNRTAGEDEPLNVHDLCAKDKGSYSLLVQASVVTGDWGSAVESLNEMVTAGMYPDPRHCNIWSEISERHTRPRAVGSWKKKRDDYWTESIN